ncbi:unnamed protein product [Prorocentrum cordatum]|uniref:Uncharacterized protein n=1 Tax=Prorocentrum cordatum TaxID=2364126 RepID=A0ABN9SID4_9DINO|nr:unnamed protein product [Polarella glacialis]
MSGAGAESAEESSGSASGSGEGGDSPAAGPSPTESLEEDGWQLLAENFQALEEEQGDLNEFGEDDPPRLEVGATLAWQLLSAPLGRESLGAFGVNGPPMNVMDCCPVSGRVFVANQRSLLGFSLASLRRLATQENAAGTALREDQEAAEGGEWRCERPLLLRAQANRLRCGQIAGRAVVATVDAAGGVTVVPSDRAGLEPVVTVTNKARARASGDRGCRVRPDAWTASEHRGALVNPMAPDEAAWTGAPVSTWGLALAPHGDQPPESGVGALAVSANDHEVRVWFVAPPRGERADAWEPPGGPSVDLAGGLLAAASLDGFVRERHSPWTDKAAALWAVTLPSQDSREAPPLLPLDRVSLGQGVGGSRLLTLPQAQVTMYTDSPFVKVQTEPSIPMSPHAAVSLELKSGLCQPWMRVIPVPRPFPVVRPSGCASADFNEMWEQIRMSMPTGSGGEGDLSKGWGMFIGAAEQEWCDVYQVSNDRSKHLGRAQVVSDGLLEAKKVQTWPQVQGPFGAFSDHDVLTWIAHDGASVNIRDVSAWYLRKLLVRGFEAWQWAKVAGAEGCEHLDKGAAMAPLLRLLKGSRPQSHQCRDLGSLALQERDYLRSVLINGQWPMARKREAGFRFQLAQVLVEDVAHFIARAGASVDSRDTVLLRPGARPNKAPVLQLVFPKLGHELVGPQGARWCVRCRVPSPSKAECLGAVVSRAVEANRRIIADGLNGHKLVCFVTDRALDRHHFAVVGCQVCGAATSVQRKSLARPCTKPGVHGARAKRAMEGGYVPHVKGAKVRTSVVALSP